MSRSISFYLLLLIISIRAIFIARSVYDIRSYHYCHRVICGDDVLQIPAITIFRRGYPISVARSGVKLSKIGLPLCGGFKEKFYCGQLVRLEFHWGISYVLNFISALKLPKF